MNVQLVRATALGPAANAIFLQYTAALWMYVLSVTLLGEKADRRGAVALAAGLVGIGVIVWGGWEGGQILVVLIALGSGAAYAGVVIGLRVLRGLSPVWLTVVNHLFSGLVLRPWLWGLAAPTWGQLAGRCLCGGL